MSNSPEYGQGSGTLTRAAGLVEDARADFNTIAARLTDQIAGLQGKWAGQGGRSFLVLHQAWTERQNTIVSALDEFSQSLTTTEKDNVNTDEQQGSSFTRLNGRLG